jgi:hypothetical protein
MSGSSKGVSKNYGCSDYREEMRLMGLKRKLERGGLGDAERAELEVEVARLEKAMGLD